MSASKRARPALSGMFARAEVMRVADAQREACEAYIESQAHEDWRLVRARYDDGGLSGASLDRPEAPGG
jgi:hypothetical protein